MCVQMSSCRKSGRTGISWRALPRSVIEPWRKAPSWGARPRMPDCNLPSMDQTKSAARKLASRENLCLQILMDWTAKEFTRVDLFLLEAGSNSFEICRRLQALGLRAVVMESCHVGKHAKTYADNDKMAAACIALDYLAGNAPCVWIPDAVTCERRELLHVYQNAVANHTAALNSLESYLNQFAIRTGSRGLQLERTRDTRPARLDAAAKATAGGILHQPRQPGRSACALPAPHQRADLRRTADAALHEAAGNWKDQRLRPAGGHRSRAAL